MIGLALSLVLILIARWFWKRFDEPSATQLELEASIQQGQEETQMWRAVEAQMAEEQALLEKQAEYESMKAAQRARAIPPPSAAVNDAFAALETPVESSSFDDNSDLLLVDEPIEVRQDKGVSTFEFVPSAPDLASLVSQKITANKPEIDDDWSAEVASLAGACLTPGRVVSSEDE